MQILFLVCDNFEGLNSELGPGLGVPRVLVEQKVAVHDGRPEEVESHHGGENTGSENQALNGLDGTLIN